MARERAKGATNSRSVHDSIKFGFQDFQSRRFLSSEHLHFQNVVQVSGPDGHMDRKERAMVASRILPALIAIPFLCSRPWCAEEGNAQPRAGLALTLKMEGQIAKITIVHNFLQKPDEQPKHAGFRQYTFDVKVGAGPVQVGYKGKGQTQTTVLRGRKYTYTIESMDRQENGSLSVTEENNQWTVRGVYYYMDRLFIIDETVKDGGRWVLFEEPEKK
jgi:hypothetical protein